MSADNASVETDETKNESTNNDQSKAIEEAMNRLEGMSRTIGRLTGQIEKLEKLQTATAEKKQDTAEAKTTGETDIVQNQLKERLAALEEKEKKIRQSTKANQIRQTLVQAGADESLVGLAVDSLLLHKGDLFAVQEDALGQYSVSVEESNGAVVALDEWCKAFLKTSEGKAIAKKVQAPTSARAEAAATTAKTVVSDMAQLVTMTPEQLKNVQYIP